MVERDVALEVNSSGFRHGIGMTLPEAPLVSMYLQEGGKCVTVGSDAHFAADVGNGGEKLHYLWKKVEKLYFMRNKHLLRYFRYAIIIKY